MFRKKQVLEVQFAEAVPKAFGKIQTGLEIYLVNQLKLRGWSVDKKLVKDTMSHLISNVDLDGNSVDKARVLVEFLKAKPELMEVFCKAVRIKVALMTQEGMPADALKLIKNLKVYGIQAVYIDQQPPPPKEFVNMANDFVLLCNTLDEKPAEVDEDWARRLWEMLRPAGKWIHHSIQWATRQPCRRKKISLSLLMPKHSLLLITATGSKK
jgi:hypothetical protein